ncbi:MAG: aldo/keto reductase [Candidatus Hydrogenedentes bacterium]|nr:aldo/keto reductase [Candidatus Hydrogenedentota bacterium]
MTQRGPACTPVATMDNEEQPPRLILGTVQLGMPYGIANREGRPSPGEARRILEVALANGIRYFDTAQAYGDSERVLGDTLAELGALDTVFITSKLRATLDPRDTNQIAQSIEESLERLHLDCLWCMLLHTPAWLACWDEGLGDVLKSFRNQGRIKHLGVSLGSAEDAPQCLANRDMEVVQAPCNAWDRRMVRNGHLPEFQRKGCLATVRSIYLQGLLTMTPEAVKERLPRAHDASVRWHNLARSMGLTATELAMRFALTLKAPLVVGVESVAQLEDTIRLSQLEPLTRGDIDAIADAVDPALTIDILEPKRWEQ